MPLSWIKAVRLPSFVLLVFGEASEPITLMLYGSDGRTWISVAENSNEQMVSAIQQVLKIKAPVSNLKV